MAGNAVSVRADAELVRISVVAGKLVMPAQEHRIYYNDPARGSATPGRPDEVAWLAFGLAANQRVMIEAKAPSRGRGHMARDDHGPLVTGANPLYSGKSRGAPSRWVYNVTLLDDTGKVLHTIDPTIVIEPDP